MNGIWAYPKPIDFIEHFGRFLKGLAGGHARCDFLNIVLVFAFFEIESILVGGVICFA